MCGGYNPIVRAFGATRAALCGALKVPRSAVRAGTVLAELVPVRDRRRTWAALRRAGVRVPCLELSGFSSAVFAQLVLLAVVVSYGATRSPWLAAATFVAACVAARAASRPWAVHIPGCVRTVGELAVYGTRFAEHAASGHRWTRGEVALKTRILVAASGGLTLDAVTPDFRFDDLYQ